MSPPQPPVTGRPLLTARGISAAWTPGAALLFVFSSVAMTGCSERSEQNSLIAASEIASLAVWDAGILLVGQRTTFVIPLDHPQVERADDILEIASSCECTSAEPCEYLDDAGLRRVGIRVDMLEPDELSAGRPPARLAVQLTITTRKDATIQRSVRVLLSMAGHTCCLGLGFESQSSSGKFDVASTNGTALSSGLCA